MDYVPGFSDDALNELLKGLGFDRQKLLEIESQDLIAQLEQQHFDWQNAEQFADFLVALSAKLPAESFGLKTKAIAVYDYVQSGSKTFSWGISNKIATAK